MLSLLSLLAATAAAQYARLDVSGQSCLDYTTRFAFAQTEKHLLFLS
jgi:hypothetical protein